MTTLTEKNKDSWFYLPLLHDPRQNFKYYKYQKYKSRIDWWGNFAVVLAGQLHFTFFSSYCIPFLPGFQTTKAAPSSTVCSRVGSTYNALPPKECLIPVMQSQGPRGGRQRNWTTDLAITNFLRSSVVYGCRRGMPNNLTSSSLGNEFSLSMSSQDCKPNLRNIFFK